MNTELGANYRFSNGFFTCLMLHSVACGLDTSHLLLEARVKCYAFLCRVSSSSIGLALKCYAFSRVLNSLIGLRASLLRIVA